MAAAELRAEVQQTVAPVDLTPTERETVCATRVTSGLARDCDVEPGCGDEPTFADPEEPGRVGKRENFAPEMLLERNLGAVDLLPGRGVAQLEEIRVSERVGLETECALTVEVDDLVPAEHGRLRAVPPERRPPVDDRWGDEDGCPEAALGEKRMGLLRHVHEPVVEAETDGPVARIALIQ